MTERTEPSGSPASPQSSSHSGARRFYRSRSNRVLAGVCGGIAEHYGSDPTAVRLLTLVLGLFTGIFPMIALYLVAAIVIPEGEGSPGDVGGVHIGSGQAAMVLGVLLVLAGIAGLATLWIHVQWEAVWPLILIGIAGLASLWIHVEWEAVWQLILFGLGAALVVATTRARR
jgi:phage shock protein C